MDRRIRDIEILDDRMAALLQDKTEAERLAMVDGFWRFARQVVRAMVDQDHPDWSEDEVRREVARRMSRGAF
jgi:hypothetical protein